MTFAKARTFFVIVFFALSLARGSVAFGSQLPVMPLPAQFMPGNGEFRIDGTFGVAVTKYDEPRLKRATQRFLDVLSRETGIPLWREAVVNQPHFFIRVAGPSASVQKLGEDESYQLVVSANEVQLTAANPIGALRGLQTFLQLVKVTPTGFVAPARIA